MPAYRTMLKSKIHRATVTAADLNYVGSVTIDADLMQAADLLPGERVAIVDVTNGARLETYVIEGERGSGAIGINGAAAHLVFPGDLVILISYQLLDDEAARTTPPRIVHVNAENRIVDVDADSGRPVPGSTTKRAPHALPAPSAAHGAHTESDNGGAPGSAALVGAANASRVRR